MVLRAWRSILVGLLAISWLSPLTVTAEPPAQLESVGLAQAEQLATLEKIVARTNALRSKVGVPRVRQVDYLQQAATSHSKEMLELDYFSHTSPVAGREKVKNRVQQAKGWDTKVGENIYRSSGISMAEVADRVFSAWEKSPTHYKIMVSPDFNSVGVGVVSKNDELAVTQVFSYQAIAVEQMVAVPLSGGYSLTFQGMVREGATEGGIFVNNSFKEPFQADDGGRFQVRLNVAKGATVSVSQKKSQTSYAQSLAFPIEAAVR